MLKRMGLRTSPSLRWRLIGWTAGIFSITVGLLTLASIRHEARAVRRVETLQAAAWLRHLAEMPEFRGTAAEARERLSLLSESLERAGVGLELRGRSRPDPAANDLAAVPLALSEGAHQLVYRTLPGRDRALPREAILVHVAVGGLAVALLTLATLWIFDRRLVAPLAEASHQLRRMASGGGWQPRLESTDEELNPLRSAVQDLGPGLEGQVQEWLGAERRAAAALAVKGLGETVRAPVRTGLVLASELQARGGLDARATRHVRVLVQRLDEALLAFDERFRNLYGAEGGAEERLRTPTGDAAAPSPRPANPSPPRPLSGGRAGPSDPSACHGRVTGGGRLSHPGDGRGRPPRAPKGR